MFFFIKNITRLLSSFYVIPHGTGKRIVIIPHCLSVEMETSSRVFRKTRKMGHKVWRVVFGNSVLQNPSPLALLPRAFNFPQTPSPRRRGRAAEHQRPFPVSPPDTTTPAAAAPILSQPSGAGDRIGCFLLFLHLMLVVSSPS